MKRSEGIAILDIFLGRPYSWESRNAENLLSTIEKEIGMQPPRSGNWIEETYSYTWEDEN